jgi:hypothetical protein
MEILYRASIVCPRMQQRQVLHTQYYASSGDKAFQFKYGGDKMKPKVLPAPRLVTPIYWGGRAVAFNGHLAAKGVEATIYRCKPSGGAPDKVAILKDPLQQTETVVLNSTFLGMYDRVYAIQKFDGIESPTPNINFLKMAGEPPRTPDGEKLPEPTIDTPLYVCARGVVVRNIVNGATVEILVKNTTKKVKENSVWKRALGYPACFIGLRPIEEGDEVRVTQSLPDYPFQLASGSTGYNKAEKYKGRLPPPTILEPLIECSTSFEVENTEAGAVVQVYEGESRNPIAREVASGYRTSIQLRLEADMILTVDQMLCGREDQSPRSNEADVKRIGSIEDYPAKILSKVKPGSEDVVVEGVHESIISIYADGKEIGYGTCFGIDQFGLVEPVADAEVHLVQSIYCADNRRAGSVKSKPVRSIPEDEVLLLEEESYYVVTSTAKHPMVVLFCFGKEGTFLAGGSCETSYIKLKEIAKEFSGKAIAAYMDLFDHDPLSVAGGPSYTFYKNGKIVLNEKGYPATYNGFDIDHVRKELNKLVQNP